MHPAYQFMLVVMNIRIDFMSQGEYPKNRDGVRNPLNVGEYS